MRLHMLFYAIFLLPLSFASLLVKRGRNSTSDGEKNKNKTTKFNKLLICDLPTNLLSYISLFLQNPYKSFPLVHSTFRNAVLPIHFVLNSRTKYCSELNLITKSRDLSRLLDLDNNFLNHDMSMILQSSTVFAFSTPEMVEFISKALLDDTCTDLSQYYKVYLLNTIALQLLKGNQFDALIRLFEIAPPESIFFSVFNETNLISLLKEFSDRNPVIVLLLFTAFSHRNQKYRYRFIAAALGTNISFQTFCELCLGPFEPQNFNPRTLNVNRLLRNVIRSCAYHNAGIFTINELNSMYARNVQIISALQATQNLSDYTLFLIQVASFCNTLKYNSNNFNMKDFQTLILQSCMLESLDFTPFYLEGFFIICTQILSVDMFAFFVKNTKSSYLSRFSRSFKLKLLDFPVNFKILFSPTKFKQIFGIKNQLILTNHSKQFHKQSILPFDQVSRIKNDTSRLLVLAAEYPLKLFVEELTQIMDENSKFNLFNLFFQLLLPETVAHIQNPLPHIFEVLKLLKSLGIASDCRIIQDQLGSLQFVKLILQYPDLLDEFDALNFDIFVSPELFAALIEDTNLAESLKRQDFLKLRSKFLLEWFDLFVKYDRQILFPQQIKKFFSIFGIKMKSFPHKNLHENDMLWISSVYADSRILFSNPEAYNNSLIDFIQFLTLYLSDFDTAGRDEESFSDFNLFHFKFYGFYQLWKESNLETFISFVPEFVVRNFNISFPTDFIIKHLLNISDFDAALVRGLCGKIIPRNSRFNVRIENISQLTNFFDIILPNIHPIFVKFNHKLDLFYSWLDIIGSIQDSTQVYPFLAIISREELDSIFKSPNFDTFSLSVKRKLKIINETRLSFYAEINYRMTSENNEGGTSYWPFNLSDEFFTKFESASVEMKNLYETFMNGNSSSSSSISVNEYFLALTQEERLDLNPKVLLLLSIMALCEFYRQNWVGPRVAFDHPIFEFIKNYTASKDKRFLSLVIDGEYPYRLTRQWELLIFALDTVEELHKNDPEDSNITWWYLRALYLHQRILDSPSPSIRANITSTLNSQNFQVISAQEALEAANLLQECEDEKSAQFYLDEASRLAGISFNFTGKLGRRTIHQTFDVYQLVVNISRIGEHQQLSHHAENNGCCSSHPQSVPLNDEHLMETVSFTEPSTQISTHIELAILLANARQLWRFHARDTQINERLGAFIQKILEAPSAWQIFSAGLFWRSKLEADQNRTMERACLQFKALAEQVDYVNPDSQDKNGQDRLNWSFAVWFPTEWDCDREQGLLFAGLGAFKTALEIFERREMFEEAVQCLVNLGRVEDAENVVIGQLERFPEDAKLICVLGDVQRRYWERKLANGDETTDEAFKTAEETYLRAWNISGCRLAKAQRNLGALYYVIGDYGRVISALSKAVAINPLFESSWYLLGFASIQLEDFEGALRAFTRLINLNQDSPDAWKNIAHCQSKLGNFDDAHRALLQLTRLQFDQNDAWLSLFNISLVIGEPMDAIKSLRRHVEILSSATSTSSSSSTSFTTKESGEIVEMTKQLIDLVIRVCIQSEERMKTDQAYREITLPVKRQFDSFLFDFLSQTSMSSVSEFWLQVARYLRSDRWPEHAGQVKEALLKAYRCLQTRPYDKDPASFSLITQIVTMLKEISGNDVDLIVRTVKRRCREAFEGTAEYESI